MRGKDIPFPYAQRVASWMQCELTSNNTSDRVENAICGDIRSQRHKLALFYKVNSSVFSVSSTSAFNMDSANSAGASSSFDLSGSSNKRGGGITFGCCSAKAI